MQIDNALRFSVLWLVDKPHDLASKVLRGGRLDKMKDRSGQYMRDAYLAKSSLSNTLGCQQSIRACQDTCTFQVSTWSAQLKSSTTKPARLNSSFQQRIRTIPNPAGSKWFNALMRPPISSCITLEVGFKPSRSFPAGEKGTLT